MTQVWPPLPCFVALCPTCVKLEEPKPWFSSWFPAGKGSSSTYAQLVYAWPQGKKVATRLTLREPGPRLRPQHARTHMLISNATTESGSNGPEISYSLLKGGKCASLVAETRSDIRLWGLWAASAFDTPSTRHKTIKQHAEKAGGHSWSQGSSGNSPRCLV